MKYVLMLAIVIAAGFALYQGTDLGRAPSQPQDAPTQNPDGVVAYVSRNIASLSPQKAVNGGTFYVTNITLDNGSGTVEYEDGHIALVADFTYAFAENGEVRVTSFEITE